jgi:hypothetical protein
MPPVSRSSRRIILKAEEGITLGDTTARTTCLMCLLGGIRFYPEFVYIAIRFYGHLYRHSPTSRLVTIILGWSQGLDSSITTNSETLLAHKRLNTIVRDLQENDNSYNDGSGT